MKGESVNLLLQYVDFNCKLYQQFVGDLFEKVLIGIFEEINLQKQTWQEEIGQNENKLLNNSYMTTLLSVLYTIPNHQIKVNGEQLGTDTPKNSELLSISSGSTVLNEELELWREPFDYALEEPNGLHEPTKEVKNTGNKEHQAYTFVKPSVEIEEGLFRGFGINVVLQVKERQLAKHPSVVHEDIPKNPELHTMVAKGETLDNVGLKPHRDFRTVEGRLSGFTEVSNTEVKAEILPKVREVFGISGEKAGGEKDQEGEMPRFSPETLINTIRSEENKIQRYERLEKPQPQPQPSHEQKRIIVRLEEGNVKFMFSGDRLRLSINLNEDFYRQPTAYEIQRLVQSIQSLGFNLEVVKLNGNSLYNSEHRHGSKREGKEKQFFVNEPLDESTKSFSLYL